jgi:hypothetical protein
VFDANGEQQGEEVSLVFESTLSDTGSLDLRDENEASIEIQEDEDSRSVSLSLDAEGDADDEANKESMIG